MQLCMLLLVSLLIYKDIKIKDIPGIFVDGAISTATILMLVGISKSSGYVITTSGLPHQVLEVFSSFTNSTVVSAAAEYSVPGYRYADGGKCSDYS